MSGGTRPSVLRAAWNNFLKTTFGVSSRKVVGKDQFGNVYYVFEGETKKATNRGYIPGSTQRWEQMPVEWEAWLRGRRRDPPTYEEIASNSAMTEAARLRGQELERQREIERKQEAEREQLETEGAKPKGLKEPEDGRQHDSSLRSTPLPGIKSSTVEGASGEKTRQYPAHKDYEQYPGEEPKDRGKQ